MNDFAKAYADLQAHKAEERRRAAEADLFVLPEPLPPHNHTITSIKAAERVWPHIGGMKRVILDRLAAAPDGLTRSEIVAATGLKENTVNGRCSELITMAMAYEDGERDGRKVLRVAPASRRAA